MLLLSTDKRLCLSARGCWAMLAEAPWSGISANTAPAVCCGTKSRARTRSTHADICACEGVALPVGCWVLWRKTPSAVCNAPVKPILQ